jgi:hypothetical protein
MVRRAGQTKHMLLLHHQNTSQNHDIHIANGSFENVAQFKYLGRTATNHNFIHEKMRENCFPELSVFSSAV